MEAICVIKDIYKTLYQFEKAFSEVHEITINEAMLLCCLKDNEAKSAGTICELYRIYPFTRIQGDHVGRKQGIYPVAVSAKKINVRCSFRLHRNGKRKYSK